MLAVLHASISQLFAHNVSTLRVELSEDVNGVGRSLVSIGLRCRPCWIAGFLLQGRALQVHALQWTRLSVRFGDQKRIQRINWRALVVILCLGRRQDLRPGASRCLCRGLFLCSRILLNQLLLSRLLLPLEARKDLSVLLVLAAIVVHEHLLAATRHHDAALLLLEETHLPLEGLSLGVDLLQALPELPLSCFLLALLVAAVADFLLHESVLGEEVF